MFFEKCEDLKPIPLMMLKTMQLAYTNKKVVLSHFQTCHYCTKTAVQPQTMKQSKKNCPKMKEINSGCRICDVIKHLISHCKAGLLLYQARPLFLIRTPLLFLYYLKSNCNFYLRYSLKLIPSSRCLLQYLVCNRHTE